MAMVKFAQIEPTTRCNFTCGFCCGRQMAQKDMTLETFAGILRDYPDLTHVELQGEGEPFLNKAFFEMLELVRQNNIRVSFITNGSLLTDAVVRRLLDYEIETIHCSIESAEPALFREIRGGTLEKVRQGLNTLITERNRRGLEKPSVGLAVAVLQKTMTSMPGIVDFYDELNLDGGLFVQPLQEMSAYIGGYDEEMKGQLLSDADLRVYRETLVRVDGLARLMQERTRTPTFYEALSEKRGEDEGGCPWLERGLYVANTGHIMPCCSLKDTSIFSLGEVGKTPRERVTRARQKMNARVREGSPPPGCRDCSIARQFQA